MPTVCHNANSDEASWKLYYYFNNKVFVCFTECGNMSIWKFLKAYYETRDIEYSWYDDIYLLITEGDGRSQIDGLTAPKYQSLKDKYECGRRIVELPVYNSGVLDCFIKTYPSEWLNDGISRAAMDKFNIRYSISQNKIIIPHYDVNGRLIGIRGRALNKWEVENIGKYAPIWIEDTCYKHPLGMNLYGLYENKENIRRTGICYLVESEKSVLQFDSFQRANCSVAVCGSNFNKFALALLMREASPREIVVCFDKEELPGEHKYFDKLMKLCRKYTNYANFSFIYDREDLLDLKDSPTDKGEEIFDKLIRKRVIVK